MPDLSCRPGIDALRFVETADAAGLPSVGDILAAMASRTFDGQAYEEAWPDRAGKTMW